MPLTKITDKQVQVKQVDKTLDKSLLWWFQTPNPYMGYIKRD